MRAIHQYTPLPVNARRTSRKGALERTQVSRRHATNASRTVTSKEPSRVASDQRPSPTRIFTRAPGSGNARAPARPKASHLGHVWEETGRPTTRTPEHTPRHPCNGNDPAHPWRARTALMCCSASNSGRWIRRIHRQARHQNNVARPSQQIRAAPSNTRRRCRGEKISALVDPVTTGLRSLLQEVDMSNAPRDDQTRLGVRRSATAILRRHGLFLYRSRCAGSS